jgi:hypothetical protein
MLAGDRWVSSPVSGDGSPGAQHILCGYSSLPSPEESPFPGRNNESGEKSNGHRVSQRSVRSPLQEKRGNGIIATIASLMERGDTILERGG